MRWTLFCLGFVSGLQAELFEIELEFPAFDQTPLLISISQKGLRHPQELPRLHQLQKLLAL
jgi:hypothetical protein